MGDSRLKYQNLLNKDIQMRKELKLTKDEALDCFMKGSIFEREIDSCRISIFDEIMCVKYLEITEYYNWQKGIKIN